MFEKPFTLDSTVRLIIRLSMLAVLIYAIYTLGDVLLPFVAAWFVRITVVEKPEIGSSLDRYLDIALSHK